MTLPRPVPEPSRGGRTLAGAAVAAMFALGAGAWVLVDHQGARPPARTPEAVNTPPMTADPAASAIAQATVLEADASASAPAATILSSTSAAVEPALQRPAPAPERLMALRSYTEPSAMPGPAALRALSGRTDATRAVGADATGTSSDSRPTAHGLLAAVVFASDSDQLPTDAGTALQAALQAAAASGSRIIAVVPLYDVDGGTPLSLAQRRGANVHQALVHAGADSRRVWLQDARPAAATAGLVGGRTVELRAEP